MALNFSFIRRHRHIDTFFYIFRPNMIIMMLGSKGILPHDTYGLLRTLCSRNPKTFEIRPIRATFSCFSGHKVILFHASMKRMTF